MYRITTNNIYVKYNYSLCLINYNIIAHRRTVPSNGYRVNKLVPRTEN